MLLLADESVDHRLIIYLRNQHFDVISILEESSGISDTEVLEKAFNNNALLLTEDKDFGDLAIRFRKPSHGILLLRFTNEDIEERSRALVSAIKKHSKKLQTSISVLTIQKIRIRQF